MPKVTLQLVTWNAEKYLPQLFQSLRAQTGTDWQLCVLDNHSTDRTVDILKQELKNFYYPHELVVSEENTGFAGGHNLLFKKNTSEYVMLLSADMYLLPNCIEKLVNFLDNHSEVAAVTPRLMRWSFEEHVFTDKIDSLGLRVLRNRRVVEWCQGEMWSKIKSTLGGKQIIEVFGVSGALPLYRRSAIEIMTPERNIFDPLFSTYKEDVDLAFRLRQAGYPAYVVLDAIGYHDRRAKGTKSLGDWSASINKITQPEVIKYYSYRNHLMVLYKNEYWQNVTLDFPWIFWYELKKFVYFLLFDRGVLRGLGYVWKNRKRLEELRIRNKELRKVDWKKMRKWWYES